MTPFQMYINRYITFEELENYIDVWHKHPSDAKIDLASFLGMGEYLYECFVADLDMFNSWVEYRRVVQGL